MTLLLGRRLVLRPLVVTDFPAWREVRRRNDGWLTKWEPTRQPGTPDVIEDRDAFGMRCSSRQRERQLGIGYGFGIFVDGSFCGEINLSSVQRGPFQSASAGYWIDEAKAGNSYVPEALAVLARHAFVDLLLHRIEIAIIPRNAASLRVVEKLAIREEGMARWFLEINGVWEDHMRFGLTIEDWQEHGHELMAGWVQPE